MAADRYGYRPMIYLSSLGIALSGGLNIVVCKVAISYSSPMENPVELCLANPVYAT